MRYPAPLLALFLAPSTFLPVAQAAPPPELCKVLRSFVESVQPDETRDLTFRTSWGENFRDAPEPAIAAKRCEHHDYEPARKVCEYLMESGSNEYAGANVKNAVSCLSRKTRFAPRMELGYGAFSFSYGSEHRGALVDITLDEDKQAGGMAFRLTVDGY